VFLFAATSMEPRSTGLLLTLNDGHTGTPTRAASSSSVSQVIAFDESEKRPRATAAESSRPATGESSKALLVQTEMTTASTNSAAV
jgi:hypothetical protein